MPNFGKLNKNDAMKIVLIVFTFPPHNRHTQAHPCEGEGGNTKGYGQIQPIQFNVWMCVNWWHFTIDVRLFVCSDKMPDVVSLMIRNQIICLKQQFKRNLLNV